jgi:hypothetical protein
MFTKQHYEAIANLIHHLPATEEQEDLIDVLVEEFIKLFQKDNPNFNYHKFRDACYGE